MLYQLSYLGIAPGRNPGSGPVYREAGASCPAARGCFKPYGPFPQGQDNGEKSRGSGCARRGRRQRLLVVVRLWIGRRNGVGAGQPAVEIDIAAPLRAERPRGRHRRLAADRTRLLRLHAQPALIQPARTGKPSPSSSAVDSYKGSPTTLV